MQRIPRTATNIIVAVTAAAWIIAVVLGLDDRAAYALGFIPARFSGFQLPFATAPAFLTPLTATLVHSSLIHIGFNMLILLWCGTAVERVLGRSALIGRQAGDEVEVTTPAGDRYNEVKKIEFV